MYSALSLTLAAMTSTASAAVGNWTALSPERLQECGNEFDHGFTWDGHEYLFEDDHQEWWGPPLFASPAAAIWPTSSRRPSRSFSTPPWRRLTIKITSGWVGTMRTGPVWFGCPGPRLNSRILWQRRRIRSPIFICNHRQATDGTPRPRLTPTTVSFVNIK